MAYNLRVLRSRHLHRSMTRLALLAVLLLALAPSVSRALSAGSTQVLAGWSELCTTMGLQLAPAPARALAGDPLPAPGVGDLCDYCPLVASLAMPLPPPAMLSAAWSRHRHLALPPAPRLRVLANPRGLGSRGPPSLP